MKTTISCLNVGWGDCHIIRLPSGFVLMMDGGDDLPSENEVHPLQWLNRKGISQIDLLMLTHIHEDHLNGCLAIAKHLKVKKVILPYRPFQLPQLDALCMATLSSMAVRVYTMLQHYLQLIQILEAQGTSIVWRDQYGDQQHSIVWQSEEGALRHIYPWQQDALPAYELLCKQIDGCKGCSSEVEQALEQFFYLSNHDSSVYTWEPQEGEQDVAGHSLISTNENTEPSSESFLFGGDLLEQEWKVLASRRSIEALVWKVSHHGLEDGYNARVLSWIQPKLAIVPIDKHSWMTHKHRIEGLQDSIVHQIYYTGSVKLGKSITIWNSKAFCVELSCE